MADYKKPDHWQRKAQQEGFPARSVYKLKEMDEKYGLIKPGQKNFRVLDLGAAPGSWSLYILRKNPGIQLVSVDISPLSRQYDGGLFDRDNFHFIQGDITDSVIRESIIERGPYNLIISDAAPATTGNRFVDTSRSLELAESVVAYTGQALTVNGNLAVKLFQGGGTSELLKHMQTLFTLAKSYKPASCRSDSFEMYYLGLGRK